MNRSEPKNAVKIPSGISPGRSNLEKLSQINKNKAPNNAFLGRLSMAFCPQRKRLIFGIISPTHPMIPVKEITDEVNRTAQQVTRIRSEFLLIPKEKAISFSN